MDRHNEREAILLAATDADIGVRLDAFVSEKTELTRSAATRLIEDGSVLVGGKSCQKNYRLRAGDAVEITLPEPEACEALPENIPLDVVWEDGDVIVVNKPVGMVVHPAPGNPTGTLVNALLWRCGESLSGIGGVIRPGIVHRIDKDTSGLLLVAKNDFSHVALSAQIKAHTVDRAYRAIVIGGFREDGGTVEGPIGRHPTDRKKMAIVQGGRDAVTHWTVLERLRGATLIEARLTTGRTHQIRVHMASIGHPVLGDPVYGPKRSPYPVVGGQLLHAYRIGFIHPRTGEHMLFEAEPEPRFTEWLHKLQL